MNDFTGPNNTLISGSTYIADVFYVRLDEFGAGLFVDADVDPGYADGNGEVGVSYQPGANLLHLGLEDDLGSRAGSLTQTRQSDRQGRSPQQVIGAGQGTEENGSWRETVASFWAQALRNESGKRVLTHYSRVLRY